MRLRPANEGDLLDLFRWRNDPVAVANSLSRQQVSLTEHSEWFSRCLLSLEGLMLIGELTVDGLDLKVGVCRFTSRGSGEYLVSINIDPGFRGRGIGRALLEESLTFFIGQKDGARRIHAQVIRTNAGSLRLFSGQGFQVLSTDGDVVNYVLDRESLLGGLGRAKD